MGPLIYLDSMDKRTVALGLESFRNPHEANSHLMMAASALSILPVAALFFLTQRHLLKGIALTGINR
jgi:multiple sugar transport system permease protein